MSGIDCMFFQGHYVFLYKEVYNAESKMAECLQFANLYLGFLVNIMQVCEVGPLK